MDADGSGTVNQNELLSSAKVIAEDGRRMRAAGGHMPEVGTLGCLLIFSNWYVPACMLQVHSSKYLLVSSDCYQPDVRPWGLYLPVLSSTCRTTDLSWC
eukprot:scaffold149252_cov19-Tisochrysis_lutea.AAC.2